MSVALKSIALSDIPVRSLDCSTGVGSWNIFPRRPYNSSAGELFISLLTYDARVYDTVSVGFEVVGGVPC